MSDVILTGSDRTPLASAEPVGPVDPARRIEATVVLRRRAPLPPDAGAGAPLTSAELGERYGADPADVEAVRAELTAAGLEVIAVDAASRRVRIAGPAGAVAAAFGTELTDVRVPWGTGTVSARQRQGALRVPAAVADRVVAVLGIDDRPQLATRYVRAASAKAAGYTPLQLAKAYALPDGDGSGQTIAIIELGGGYGQADLDAYFGGLGLAVPSVRAVGVDGATNVAGKDPDGADGEVLLDIEVAGAIAPKAALVVYFAPNTDAGFLDAISEAAHASPAPVAMSISWGQSEDAWTAQARTAMDEAFADAAALGVTVTAAAGDDGSTDRTTDRAAHCDFPASSPHVLGCGGTSLHLAADGTVRSETVWGGGGSGAGATGGGVSDVFAVPDWQAHVGVPARAGGGSGRGVPDVAADADPETGYRVQVDGQAGVIGGTSAVAPLWAGLVARLAQALGRPLGLLQPALYGTAGAGQVAPGFRDITSGSNGAYTAAPGWDACTGLGVPVGTDLLAALRGGG